MSKSQAAQVAQPDGPGPVTVGSDKSSTRESLGKIAAAYGALGVLVIVIVGFSIALPETYPTSANLKAILSTQSVVLMLSLGLLVPAVVGEFDLSVGAMLAFASVETAVLLGEHSVPLVLAILVVLLTSGLIGLASGLLVVRFGVSSFIATLGMSTVLLGLSLWLSGGGAVTEGVPLSVTDIGRGTLLGIPLPAVYAFVIAVILWYVLTQMPVGRRLYATGGNRIAADLSGVKTKRLVAWSFVASAVIAALAGVVSMTRSGAGDPAVGPDLLLPAFAAVFLGATTIRPGRFNVWGTLIGILLVACGVAGLQQLGAEPYIVPLFNGIVLIAAVAISRALSTGGSRL